MMMMADKLVIVTVYSSAGNIGEAVVSFTVCCDTCIYALDAGYSTIIIGYHMQGRVFLI